MANENSNNGMIPVRRPGLVLRSSPRNDPEEEAMVVSVQTADGRNIAIQPRPLTQSIERSLGQRNWRQKAGGRIFAPEAANADISLVEPGDYFDTAGEEVLGAYAIEGALKLSRMDYNAMANMTYLRDAAAIVGALGRNDQAAYDLTGGGTSGIWTMQNLSGPNLILGFQIEYSINLLNAASFNMNVVTSFFQGQNLQDVNRSFTVWCSPSGNGGGIFQFLFGNRTASTSAGYYYNGAGGMSIAIVQPAQIGPTYSNTPDAPLLTIAVPSNIAPYIGLAARPITAASPALANLREVTSEFTVSSL